MRSEGTWEFDRLMHGTKPGVGLIVSAAVAVCAACGAVNERPYLTPLPNANVDSVHALPSAVITEIETLLVAQGMEIRLSTPTEGYLETKWYDIGTGHAGGVRFRFFASPVGEELTELTSEAVIRNTHDPSLPERENERMVSEDHPGHELLSQLLAALEEHFGTGHS